MQATALRSFTCLGCKWDFDAEGSRGPLPRWCVACKPEPVAPKPSRSLALPGLRAVPASANCKRCTAPFEFMSRRPPAMCPDCRPFANKRYACGCGALLYKAPNEHSRKCYDCKEQVDRQKEESRRGTAERIAANRRASRRRAEAQGIEYVSIEDRKRLGLPLRGPLNKPTAEEIEARAARARETKRAGEERRARRKAEAAGREYVPPAERKRRAAEKLAAKPVKAPRIVQPWHDRSLTVVEKRNLRRRLDKEYDVRCRMTEQLKRATPEFKARRMGMRLRDAVRDRRASKALEARLGYTIAALVRHLDLQFTKGMTWEAFAAGQIHIDHRTPLRMFDVTTEEGLRAAWALTNLQPLWAPENQRKAGNVLFLI